MIEMKQLNFQTKFSAFSFMGSGLAIVVCWALLPVHIHSYFVSEDFIAIKAVFYPWVWLFRFFFCGWILAAMALFSVQHLSQDPAAKMLLQSGAAGCLIGITSISLGQAFYYHFGALGAYEYVAQGTQALEVLIANLQLDSEFVTCFVRFGRAFYGFGLIFFSWGLLKSKLVPRFISIFGLIIGVGSMGITMLFPNEMNGWVPVFYANGIWLVCLGFSLLKN